MTTRTKKPMRLPRWLVVSLLSASMLAVLGAGAGAWWWWVTGPERTARRFAALMADRNLVAVNEMLSHGPVGVYRKSEMWVENPNDYFPKWLQVKLRQKPRSVLDFIQQRSHFTVILDGDSPFCAEELLIERDAVALECGIGIGSSWEPAEEWEKPLRIQRVEIRDPSDWKKLDELAPSTTNPGSRSKPHRAF